MKSRKRPACDVFDTSATRSGLVYDVTDTDCGAQNGRTHCYDFATYKRWSLKTEDEKIVVTEYCSVSIKKREKKRDFFL